MLNNLLRKPRQRPAAWVSAIREDTPEAGLLSQKLFLRLLCLERKRTERSGRRFVLMLLDTGKLLKGSREATLPKLLAAIGRSIRDTDLQGWYQQGAVIGVIFTEVGTAEDKAVVQALSRKLTDSLYEALTVPEINEIRLSFHLFPEVLDNDDTGDPVTSSLRESLTPTLERKKIELGAKRLMDIVGSLVGLILALPVILLIILAIKLTSRGPVLFRQARLGQHGKKFSFLKFRSMHANNDSRIHQDFVKSFIVGNAGPVQSGANQPGIYKLTSDPRITPVGRFLRSTSLDELPQFLNVLAGDMSLVGPRPPVPYEFECYSLWHKQRLLAVRPGITGLWQVDGRSRVKFEEMVRLDIRYARSWSLWLDVKILLRTPGAVFSGIGAC